MKQIIKFTAVGTFVLVILLLSSQVSQAQQRGQQGPPPLPNDKQIEAMVVDLSKELSLTVEQEKKVSEKYFTHFEEVENKMKAGRPSREDMEKVKSEFEDDIKSVLTDDQKDLYDSFLKKQKQQRPPR